MCGSWNTPEALNRVLKFCKNTNLCFSEKLAWKGTFEKKGGMGREPWYYPAIHSSKVAGLVINDSAPAWVVKVMSLDSLEENRCKKIG